MYTFSLSYLVLGFIAYAEVRLAKSLETENIVGGNIVPIGTFTYAVKLLREQKDQTGICGGAIISNRHVVTAAHCVICDNVPLMNLRVSAGIVDKKSGFNVTVDVQEFYLPKEYTTDGNSVQTSDIAVLKLTEELGIGKTPFISSLDLPAHYSYEDEKATIVGFGINAVIIEEMEVGVYLHYVYHKNANLRYGETYVLKQHECQRQYNGLSHKHLCARMVQRPEFEYEGACRGDSGGPLVFMHTTLIGVQSMGPADCNEKTTPGVYTRVNLFLNFLKTVMNGTYDPRTTITYRYNLTEGFVLKNAKYN